MKKKKVFFLSFLFVPLIFLLSSQAHLPANDLRDYINFKRDFGKKSMDDYKKYLKAFGGEFPGSVLTEEAQKWEPYFLFKERQKINWKNLSLRERINAMNLILDHYAEFDPVDVESSFNELIELFGRERLFKETFSKYVKNVAAPTLNQKMKNLAANDFKLAKIYGWYFFQTGYYSFSDAIFKTIMNKNQEDSLYHLGVSYFQQGNYGAASSYLERYLKFYPAFNNNPESKSYRAYDFYFRTLYALGKYDEAFLKLQNFNRKRASLPFYYREYLLAKRLKKPTTGYERRLVSLFPKSNIAGFIKRRNLISKIKNHRDYGSFEKLKELSLNRGSYMDMLYAVVFKNDQISQTLKNTDDLFYYYVFGEDKYELFPEVKQEIDEWLKNSKDKFAGKKKTEDPPQSFSKVEVFYWGDDELKKKLLADQNDFFRKYFNSNQKLDRRYERRIEAFLEAGMGDLILREIEKIYKEDEVQLFLAKRYLYREQKDYYSNLSLVRKYLSASHEEMFATSEILEDLYPKPYYSFISRLAAKYKVPVDLVYAIIRTESAFQDKAKSHAGAEGLMQIMPFLSKQIYNENAEIKKKYGQYDPYNVYMNLEIGIYHLSQLYKEFDKNLLQVAAAYNAGSSRAKDWSKDSKNWLEYSLFIPFNETQNYVNRVFRSFEIYRNLYR